jgi:hypothetical protein
MDQSGVKTPSAHRHPAFEHPARRSARQPIVQPGIPTLGEVLLAEPNDIARLQLGFLNLVCATGLPDTLDLDIRACLQTLEAWTQHVRAETERNLHRFCRDPGDYQHSEGYFRVLMMVTVLQQDCGVRYNPASIETPLFLNSEEGFIHGLLTGKGMGTCANMPVLYAAVGRKLNYPIYLCLASAHVFCRWATKDGRERFNIEGSGVGLNTPEDDHYHNWPHRISDREVHLGHYLRNLDPLEELGLFMATRGHCLLDRAHILEAIVAYSHAHRLAPTNPTYFSFLLGAINREIRDRESGKIPCDYREAEIFGRADCPQLVQYVLHYDFRQVAKRHEGGNALGRLAPNE